MSARTQQEILSRLMAVIAEGNDWLGFRQDVLLGFLTRETAQKAFPDADLTGEWEVRTDAEADAREYLTLAIGKAVGHRGISASRSTEKLAEFAWLLGRDDVAQAMEAAEYEQYGVPKLKAFAEGMGWPWPGEVSGWQSKALTRMAQGLPCQDDCAEGCGR